MNCMKKIAEMLGVELKEEFVIKGSTNTYRLTEDGVWCKKKDSVRWYCPDTTLNKALAGECKIIRKPWKPKKGEVYWLIAENACITDVPWENDMLDLLNYALGNCFHSREEAEKYKDKFVDYLEHREPDTSWRD